MFPINIRPRSAVACLIVVALGLIIFGCGGGGGGGGSSTTTSTSSGTSGTLTDVKLYALYNRTQAPASNSLSSGSSSALALAVGDQIDFSFIGLNSSKAYVTASGGTLSTNAPSSVASLNGNVLQVVGTSGSASYNVTGTYKGTAFTYTFSSVSRQANVSGVVDDTNGNVVVGAPIKFYNSTGTIVGETTTGLAGTFVGSVPTSATHFQVDLSNLSAYFNEFAYSSLNYTAAVSACYAPLPSLTTGRTSPLPSLVVAYDFNATDPPPAPSGCS